MNDKEIDNVRFSEAIYLQGRMDSNIKVGRYNSTITLTPGGVLIEIPPEANAPRFITFVPYSKIKQIEFKA